MAQHSIPTTIGTPSLVRGAGTALAMLVPGGGRVNRFVRSAVVAGAYVGSRTLLPAAPAPAPPLAIDEDDPSLPAPVKQYGNLALGTASWVGVQALLAHAAALLPLPKLLKALLLGGAVTVVDQQMSDRAAH